MQEVELQTEIDASMGSSEKYGPETTYDDASEDEGNGSSFSRWQRHPVYPIGIRMAELATMFYTNGWAQSKFPEFLTWAKQRLPQSPTAKNHA